MQKDRYPLISKIIEKEYGKKVEKEYKFHPKRRWKFDYCILEDKIVIEVEGAVWANGRHTRGSGFVKDMEKYNTATAMGYKVIRIVPGDYKSLVKYLDMIYGTNRKV